MFLILIFRRLEDIRKNAHEYIETQMEKRVLDKMIDIVAATKKTNVYNPDRFAFGIKLDPQVCMDENDPLRT